MVASRRVRRRWSPDVWVRAFLARVSPDTTGCWVWTGQMAGRTDTGGQYGFVRKDGRMQYAHRAYYEFARGPIPEGLDLDHLCRNRACVNPDHLEPVTRSVNVRRGVAALSKTSRTECPQGHAYDERNTYTRDGKRHCRACKATRAAAARALIRERSVSLGGI